MTTGRINQVTRRHACKGPGNSNKAEPSETQRNTVAIKILALKRSKDRQTANKFLPPGNVRTLAREASARTRETTRHNTGEDRYSPESTVRCQATVHADAQTPAKEARANSVRGAADENIPQPKARFLGPDHSNRKSLTERPMRNFSQPTTFSPT